jgi:hypothetical protein
MNDFIFAAIRPIPIYRFHKTDVIIRHNESNEIFNGKAFIDQEFEELTLHVKNSEESVVFDFEELSLLRWEPSGLVRDCYFDESGDMIHVPELRE